MRRLAHSSSPSSVSSLEDAISLLVPLHIPRGNHGQSSRAAGIIAVNEVLERQLVAKN